MPELARAQRIRILPVARDFTPSASRVEFSGRAVTNDAYNNSGEWTLMAWAKVTATGQQTFVSQTRSTTTRECGMYLDSNQTISIHSGLSPTYFFNTSSAATYQTNRWECFLAAGTSNGWASYTRSSNAYVFNSTGDQRVVPSGAGILWVGNAPDSAGNNWNGPIGLVAVWAAFLNEREAKALGAGVAPWKIRSRSLRFLWAPRTRAGPDFNLVGNRYGTLSGSPTLASFPARGLIRP